MTTWVSETSKYLATLNEALSLVNERPNRPDNIPRGPLAVAPTPLQSVLHRAATLYEVGLWLRARETLLALRLLWQEGYLSPAAALARLVFELWGACHYQTRALQRFRSDLNLASLANVVDRLFEGVRGDVLMPWGVPAAAQPIHVMDLVRELNTVDSRAEAMYNDLCESSHANQPRFFEWWLTGRLGDNWTNKVVQTRGHDLLERTVAIVKTATEGLVRDARVGLQDCGVLYEVA